MTNYLFCYWLLIIILCLLHTHSITAGNNIQIVFCWRLNNAYRLRDCCDWLILDVCFYLYTYVQANLNLVLLSNQLICLNIIIMSSCVISSRAVYHFRFVGSKIMKILLASQIINDQWIHSTLFLRSLWRMWLKSILVRTSVKLIMRLVLIHHLLFSMLKVCNKKKDR